MADANRNSTGNAERQNRQQRNRQAVQPGATGNPEDEGLSPEEARDRALHTHGKTNRSTSSDADLSH
jgi:hypothetical protein